MATADDEEGVATDAAPATPTREETRRQIILAAQEVFASRGYAQGRTLDIAERAQVAERTLFRHFATKAELFTAAVVDPFHGYMEAFVDDWRHREHGVLSAWEETRLFYAGLFDLLERHRGLVVALVAAREFEPEAESAFPAIASAMAETLSRAEPILEAESRDRGFRGSPAIGVRFMFGLAISAVVHGDWLFTSKARPSSDELVDEITAFTLYGLGAAPDA